MRGARLAAYVAAPAAALVLLLMLSVAWLLDVMETLDRAEQELGS